MRQSLPSWRGVAWDDRVYSGVTFLLPGWNMGYTAKKGRLLISWGWGSLTSGPDQGVFTIV